MSELPPKAMMTYCEEVIVEGVRCGDRFPEENEPLCLRLIPAMGGVFLASATCKPCWQRILRWMAGKPTEHA